VAYGYSVRKADRNQGQIVAALRKAGYGVVDLHTLGGGVPDILAHTPWNTLELIEIKMPGEDLSPDERDWHSAWRSRGGHVHIAYDKSIIEELEHEHTSG
jgi:hypothetical protein